MSTTPMRLRIALAIDRLGHELHLPGGIQFYLCQWVGRETLRGEYTLRVRS